MNNLIESVKSSSEDQDSSSDSLASDCTVISETSSVEDANHIHTQEIDEDIIADIERRKTTLEKIQNPEISMVDDYQACVALLKTGIVATKYNFSNEGHREVDLSLSDDNQIL